MYISISREKHIFDSGLESFFYLFVNGVFTIVIFLYDFEELITTSNLTDTTIKTATTGSLSLYGFLFFATITYDFWSRYTSVFLKHNMILNILLALWLFYLGITIAFLIFVLMSHYDKSFTDNVETIFSIINYLKFTALVPLVISIVECIRFAVENHNKKLDENQKMRDFYKSIAV